MEKRFFVYMLANRKRGVLYIGVSSNLPGRVWQHKQSLPGSFTDQYNVKSLVWFEECITAESAIRREKQLKKWMRSWKLRLVESMNPEWRDLYPDICA